MVGSLFDPTPLWQKGKKVTGHIMNHSLAKCLCIFHYIVICAPTGLDGGPFKSDHTRCITKALHFNTDASLFVSDVSGPSNCLQVHQPAAPWHPCWLSALEKPPKRRCSRFWRASLWLGVGGAAPCGNLSSPAAATVPLIPFLLFIYDVSGLQITSVPITTSSHNKYL